MTAVDFEKLQQPDVVNIKIYETVEKKVRQKFHQANPRLPLITESSATNKIRRAFDSADLLDKKRLKSKRKKYFIDSLDKVFDLVICQCELVDCAEEDHDCGGVHVICHCENKDKIPKLELAWIKDQRDKIGTKGGKFIMRGVDKKEAKTYKNKVTTEENKVTAAESKKSKGKKLGKAQELARNEFEAECANTEENIPENTDSEFKTKLRGGRGHHIDHNQNRTNLDFFIAEVVRYGWSDRAAAAAYNAALKSVGVIRDGDDKLAVDKNKIRRSRDSFAAKQQKKHKTKVELSGGLKCIGSDGKRNKKTKQREIQVINGIETVKVVTKSQEHIAYTIEPEGSYLTHSEIKATKGTGLGLAEDFLDVLIENNSETTLEAVVCDGTNSNTGWKDGMLSHLERKLDPPRPILRLVCQAHGIELSLRTLFSHCDGGFGTSGPTSFEGPIGKCCAGEVHLKDVVKFDCISTTLPDLDEKVWKDLSRDQQLLYRYVKAISAGDVPEDLARQVAGPINHSRWLTLAIRLMQLYTRTQNPSPGLVQVVKFIMQVYTVVWFSIKAESKFTYGPIHLFKQMTLIKSQSLDTQAVVKATVQRNAYFAHTSTMLCSMLESADMRVRVKAVQLIKQARLKPPKQPRIKALQGIRKYVIPPLQWQAKKWSDIVDWKSQSVHECSILSNLESKDLDDAITTPLSFPSYPLHSQSVERCVKLVSESAIKVVGGEKRHQHILSVVESRRMRKASDTKKDFKYTDDS